MQRMVCKAFFASLCGLSMMLSASADALIDGNQHADVFHERKRTSRQTQYIVLSPLNPRFQSIDRVGGEQINRVTGMLVKEWCHVIEVMSDEAALYWTVSGDDVMSKPIPRDSKSVEQALVCTFADEAFYHIEFSAHPMASYQLNIQIFEKCRTGVDCE